MHRTGGSSRFGSRRHGILVCTVGGAAAAAVIASTLLLLHLQQCQACFASTVGNPQLKIRSHFSNRIRGGASLLPSSSSSSGGKSVDTSQAGSSNDPPEIPSIVLNSKKEPFLPAVLPTLPTLAQYRKVSRTLRLNGHCSINSHTLSQFALPCLALWVAGPLLSLVDTAFIGLSSTDPTQSAAQLAALGPATTFFDGATFLFAFLNVATTNLYSSAQAAVDTARPAQRADAVARTESVVRTAARVALRSGVGIMLFLLAASRPLLRLYIGEQAIQTPGLLDSAVAYVTIRALSMPTSLLLGVLQAALLGSKDSVTPLIAILYATIVNVTGDYLLCCRFKMGLTGAALATLLAQWASTWALVRPSRRKLVANHDLQLRRAFSKSSPSAAPASNHLVTSSAFLSFAAPVLTLILGKLAAFGFMTNAAASVPGQPTPLASHQIILSLLFFCSPFLEVISQTAQTFLPPYLAPRADYLAARQAVGLSSSPDADPALAKTLQPWTDATYQVAASLLRLGLWSGAAVASVACLVPRYFGFLITSNTSVQAAARPLAKYLWLGAMLWAPVAVGEGILLAQRELKFLALVYLISTALLPPALLQVRFRQGDVGQVWFCFCLFQLFRAACFTVKIWGPRVRARWTRKEPTLLLAP
jgi:Na+-driven multidrug efflux pump